MTWNSACPRWELQDESDAGKFHYSRTARQEDEETSYLAAFGTPWALHPFHSFSEIAVSTIIKPAGFPGERGTSLRCARRNTCPSSLAVPARSI